MAEGLIQGADWKHRCFWCGDDPLYMSYHDREWGKPVHDDVRLFEKICLEGFQSGLSWITILRKRENFRAAFDGFDFEKVRHYGAGDVERLMRHEGIIRHRGKIEATINNAARAIDLRAEFGSLSAYFWTWRPQHNDPPSLLRSSGATSQWVSRQSIPSKTPESIAFSKDLKKRGWKFVGPTTCYAFMQAMGMVNDHITGCDFR